MQFRTFIQKAAPSPFSFSARVFQLDILFFSVYNDYYSAVLNRNIATHVFFGLCIAYNVFLTAITIRKIKSSTSTFTKIQWAELIAAVALILHAIFGIVVIALKAVLGTFQLQTIGFLFASCFFVLVYQVAMVVLLTHKLNILLLRNYAKKVALLFAGSVAAAKIVLTLPSICFSYISAAQLAVPIKALYSPAGRVSYIMNLSGNVIYAVFVCAVQLIYVYKIIIFVKNREMLTQTNNSNFNSSLESDKGNNQATRTTQSEMAAKTTLKSVANLFNSHKYIVAMLVAFTLINFIVSVLSLSVIPHSLGIAINSFLSSVFLHICVIFDGIVKTRISAASKMHQSPSKSTIQPGQVRI